MAASNRPVTIEDIIIGCASKRAAMSARQSRRWNFIAVQRGFCLPAAAEAYRQAVETIASRQLTSFDRIYMAKMCSDGRSQSDEDLLDSLTKSAVESVYATETFSLNRAVGILLTVSDLVVRAMTSGEEDRVFRLTGWCTDLFNGNLTTYGKPASQLSEWLKTWMVERDGLKRLLSEATLQHDLPHLELSLNQQLPPDYKPFQTIQIPPTNLPSKRPGSSDEAPITKKPGSAAAATQSSTTQAPSPGSVVYVPLMSQKPATVVCAPTDEAAQHNLMQKSDTVGVQSAGQRPAGSADKAPNVQAAAASLSATLPLQPGSGNGGSKCKCGTDKASNVLKQQTMARCQNTKCVRIWCRIHSCKQEFTTSLGCFTHQEYSAHQATHRKLLQTNVHPNILTDMRCKCSGTAVPVFSTGGFMGRCRLCNVFRCLVPNCGKTYPSVNLYATHHISDHLGCAQAAPSPPPSICGVCGTQRCVVMTPAISEQCNVCDTHWCVIGNCHREFLNISELETHQKRRHKEELS